ncbi:MAG: peptidase [Candidatus Handelsmanbacteria bacterium]|nr:peptidase [Candidatus Handelsmanbacteria bacterium]
MPLLLLCLCFWWGCGDRATGPKGEDSRLVGGVDFTSLFAPPTSAELALIAADWESRPAPQSAADTLYRASLSLGRRRASLCVLAYEVEGLRQYGALLVPDGAAPGSLPLVVYLHGGDQGISMEEFLLVSLGLGEDRDQYAYALPSFRSEALRYGQEVFLSEGEASPWDRDVDDALGLVAVALAVEPAIDPQRLGAVGISRGGAVALLLAQREPRLRRVVEFFGPTDLLDEFGQEVAAEVLQGQPRPLPGVEYLTRTLLLPLRLGALSLEEARLGLIRRSPVYFAGRLPAVQVHHGTADPLVPVGQARRLAQAMEGLGRAAPEFEVHIYPEGSHHPLSLPGSLERTQAFLSPLRQPAPAYGAALPY